MNYLNTETLNKLAKIRNSIMEDNGVTQVELMESVGMQHNITFLKELVENKFSDYEMREYAKDKELYQEDYNDKVAELQEELAEDPELDIEDAYEEQILEHVVEKNKTSIELSILEDIKEEIEETLLKSISTYNI